MINYFLKRLNDIYFGNKTMENEIYFPKYPFVQKHYEWQEGMELDSQTNLASQLAQ